MLWLITSLTAEAQDQWRIDAAIDTVSHYFGATVANGQIGITSSSKPLKLERMVLGGLYDINGNGRVANFMHGIKSLDLELSANGSRMGNRDIKSHVQTLDMQEAWIGGTFNYSDYATVTYRYRALRNLPFCSMLEVEVQPQRNFRLGIENLLEVHESFNDPREYFVTVQSGNDTYYIASSTALTPKAGIEIGGAAVIIPDRSYPIPVAEHLSNRRTGVHSQRITVDLKKGRPYHFYVIGSLLSEVTHTDVRNELERLSLYCAVEGPERLINKHLDKWARLWESDIEIEGDPQAQQDVHNMLFNLYGFVREDSGLSISPMGLSGFGYNGHVFWDCETWIYPALLLLHPELARTFIDYRFNNLEAARMNAYMYGCRGAKYPWQSGSDGREHTPSHNLYGPMEKHVTADVAIAAWQYFQVTRDLDWLANEGYPIIKACADFFTDCVDIEPDGTVNLINVIGADEWNVNPDKGKNVNNNAYTIGAVISNITAAQKAARLLGVNADPQWDVVARGLKLKQMPNGVIREHDSYVDKTPTKQADVVLLAYPLDILTDTAAIRLNLEYYLSTVPRKKTPAMSKSVYSILFSRLNDNQNAKYYFDDSYKPNLQMPFRVIAEFDGGTNPYFITGAGGSLQSILNGFGGLRITDNGIIQAPACLPDGWTRLILKGIGKDKLTYTITKQP